MARVDAVLKAGDTLPSFQAQLLDATGMPIDLTDAVEIGFMMAPEGSQVLAVDGLAAVVGSPVDGTVEYAWQDGDTAVPAMYQAAFKVTEPGGSRTYPPADFLAILIQPSLTTPVPGTGPSFVALADVLAVTGRDDIDEADLNIAWQVIEGVVGRPLYEVVLDTLTVRDAFWLKKATAWQAAWCADNPDVFSAFDVGSMNQAGQSAVFNPDGQIVAPMARRCLRWVSWTKTRSVKIQRPFPYGRLLNPTAADELGQPWRGM